MIVHKFKWMRLENEKHKRQTCNKMSTAHAWELRLERIPNRQSKTHGGTQYKMPKF